MQLVLELPDGATEAGASTGTPSAGWCPQPDPAGFWGAGITGSRPGYAGMCSPLHGPAASALGIEHRSSGGKTPHRPSAPSRILAG